MKKNNRILVLVRVADLFWAVRIQDCSSRFGLFEKQKEESAALKKWRFGLSLRKDLAHQLLNRLRLNISISLCNVSSFKLVSLIRFQSIPKYSKMVRAETFSQTSPKRPSLSLETVLPPIRFIPSNSLRTPATLYPF